MAEYVSVPATDLFPLLEGEEFEALVADIKANGLLEEIVVDRQKRIIDGRNRWRACQLLSMAPPERVFEGSDAEIVAYSISKNLHRRHLNQPAGDDRGRAGEPARRAARKGIK